MAADPTYPLYPFVAFVGCVLALVPLPWHLQSWNSGTCYYMIWTSLACLNQFVNSVVWSSNALNIAPVWCDISTRITIGASVGIPAASLCINRRLYDIARMQAVAMTRAEKQRAILVDTLICVVFPIVCMALAYIVQGHRFNIFEVIGCYPAIYNTVPTYFLVYMWPVVVGLISAVYCVLSLRLLIARHAQFREFISSGSGLTSSRYFRLMALATTDMLFTIPFGIYELYSNAASGEIQPWLGWANTHFGFSRVDQYPALVWMYQPSIAVPLQLSRWIIPACAFIFFTFFGFAEEARKRYAALYASICNRLYALRIMRMGDKHERSARIPSASGDSLPPYSPQSASTSGFDSLASITAVSEGSSSASTETFDMKDAYGHEKC